MQFSSTKRTVSIDKGKENTDKRVLNIEVKGSQVNRLSRFEGLLACLDHLFRISDEDLFANYKHRPL